MKPAKELAIAAAAGDAAKVTAMLDRAPELAKDWQPIMDACFWGRAEIVKLLLARGADPNVMSRSTFRYRPLHRTVEHKVTTPRGPEHLKTVEVLLDGGADVMARGAWCSVTPIALAAWTGETQFLPLLRQKAPEPDLFTAAVLGDAGRVSTLLLEDPAAATRPDENGWTALKYCAGTRADQGDPAAGAALLEIARALLRHGADPGPALGPAIGANRAAMVELLLQSGAVLNDGDALVHAAEGGNFAVLEILVQHGVDLQCTIGTEHHGGYTPLGLALAGDKAKAADFLQQIGGHV